MVYKKVWLAAFLIGASLGLVGCGSSGAPSAGASSQASLSTDYNTYSVTPSSPATVRVINSGGTAARNVSIAVPSGITASTCANVPANGSCDITLTVSNNNGSSNVVPLNGDDQISYPSVTVISGSTLTVTREPLFVTNNQNQRVINSSFYPLQIAGPRTITMLVKNTNPNGSNIAGNITAVTATNNNLVTILNRTKTLVQNPDPVFGNYSQCATQNG